VLLTHGELFVVNTGNGGKILHNFTRASGTTAKGCGETFQVCGSANEDINPKISNTCFSHLYIDEGVVIDASQGLNAITVDVLENAIGTNHSYNDCTRANSIQYHTNIFGSTDGVAHGVKIEIKGTIIAYKYAYKTNGNVRHPYEYSGTIKTDINGGEFSGMTKESTDTAYAPYLHIYPSASLTVTSSTLTDAGGQAIAVYSSGYSRMLIEGNCAGNVGVYAKSGDIELHNATITSTNEKVTNPTETPSGSKAQGSAVIVQSTGTGSGEINLIVTGDTEISATSGYGIQETVTKTNSSNGSYTSSVTVESGTVSGGGAGAIAVTTKDANNNYVVTVSSGNISGNIVSQGVDEEGAATSDTTKIDLKTIVSDTINTHTTVVYTSTGDSVLVVNPGKATATEATSIYTAHVTDHKDTIKWTGTSETISVDMELKELEINDKTTPQVLTIGNNATVKIGKVLLGSKAQIVVTPGAKLIVTGNDGIYSRENSNLVLQANSDSQATFLIGTNVRSNRQPQATVQYTLNAGMPTASSYIWQRFTTPLCVTNNPQNDKEDVLPTYMIGTNLITWGEVIDDETETWNEITSWKNFRPFHAGALTNNTDYNDATKRITYTFKGKLVGNVTDSISRRNARWNYYGNSFMAPMSTKALIDTLATQAAMEPTIWYWILGNQGYSFVSRSMIKFGEEGIPENLSALSFFVLKNNSSVAGDLNINYKKTIFDYAIHPSSYAVSAPARKGNYTTVRINVESENGAKDAFYLLEDENNNAEYEAGDDVEKLMGNGLNFYAADENYNYNLLATDNVLGTLLTIQTVEDMNYTMTFDRVNGEIYALRDNITNAVVLMNEGATYNFTAQPNATMEGRFQIVSRQEMPTAVETVEETVNAPKAIYTIMGQYVGETTEWNNLPAGVYVVDGVKVIK
jgi:hypothetical protein